MKAGTGYVYVPDADPGRLAEASPGAVVRNLDPAPPWIVVDHAIGSVCVARWPGRLWRVEVLDTDGVPQASAHASYTRAVAVRVLDEVPAWSLFGEHGESVVAILSFASRLDAPTAERLAACRHPRADQAYSRAWRKWLDAVGCNSLYPDADFRGTLAAGSGACRSPIRCGLLLVHRAVWERAEAHVGPDAFLQDDEGERTLGPVWGAAAASLLDAAMALGAPEVTVEEDAAILTAACRAVGVLVTPGR
jgi:hypothetical protein